MTHQADGWPSAPSAALFTICISAVLGRLLFLHTIQLVIDNYFLVPLSGREGRKREAMKPSQSPLAL